MENWIVGLLGVFAIGLMVLLKGTRRQLDENHDRAEGIIRARETQIEHMGLELETRNSELETPAIRIVLSELDDGVLASYLAAGPEALVWKGVEECVRRLKDRTIDEVEPDSSAAVKVAAIDCMAALDDLLLLMRQWHQEAMRIQQQG